MVKFFHKIKMKMLCKATNPYSIIFHIVGIACIVWFLVRVLPKPDRIRYPCQQMTMSFTAGYIAFWVIMWSAMFHGLGLWIKKAKYKTTAILPVLLICFVLLFSVSTVTFAQLKEKNINPKWTPISKDPIGTPKGLNPGRVVWVWDPDATETNLNGFWWNTENNNQDVIDKMFSKGINNLAGLENIKDAWNALFKFFNLEHENNEVGYQPGEKIAIKINLNNCWQANSYIRVDNERDASPYVVKALLRQLVNIVGIPQEDIYVYDASRPMGNWFYDRVYYKDYSLFSKTPEFPDVHFVDMYGGATGREKVEPSTERIYFADGTGLYRTLPTIVVDAKYIINMPILKRHPIDYGVTLSGKNFFGTWIEPVVKVHKYHQSGFTYGNPTPQTDLFAHKNIGGKTILYIGDGTFATKADHCTIAKFEMYPFNNDWTNSLFFSQDPVAIDSVMYDFLYTEGCNPCEGSQNYLHQSAEPNADTYDPENDGEFLNQSLGVHEHWDTSVEIFSSNRYSGKEHNGIDYIAINKETDDAKINIINPEENYLYINQNKIIKLRRTIVVGDINIETEISGIITNIEKVEFYVDNEKVATIYEQPYTWIWKDKSFSTRTLKTIAYYEDKTISDQIRVIKI